MGANARESKANFCFDALVGLVYFGVWVGRELVGGNLASESVWSQEGKRCRAGENSVSR